MELAPTCTKKISVYASFQIITYITIKMAGCFLGDFPDAGGSKHL
jgi:hypothetical protein